MLAKTVLRGLITAILWRWGGVVAFLGLIATNVHAQGISVLSSFSGSGGANPYGAVTLIGDTLYGTAANGGANGDGTIFSVPVSGGSATILASFSGSNGANPWGGLIVSDATLYGTSYYGGDYGRGTVFSVPVTGGSVSVLASFNGINGANPMSGLTLSGGALYGTCSEGGAYGYSGGGVGYGSVFSVPLSGGSLSVLASFNGNNGEYPYSGLTLGGNTLYGTTVQGGV